MFVSYCQHLALYPFILHVFELPTVVSKIKHTRLLVPGDLWLLQLQAKIFGFPEPQETPKHAPDV